MSGFPLHVSSDFMCVLADKPKFNTEPSCRRLFIILIDLHWNNRKKKMFRLSPICAWISSWNGKFVVFFCVHPLSTYTQNDLDPRTICWIGHHHHLKDTRTLSGSTYLVYGYCCVSVQEIHELDCLHSAASANMSHILESKFLIFEWLGSYFISII